MNEREKLIDSMISNYFRSTTREEMLEALDRVNNNINRELPRILLTEEFYREHQDDRYKKIQEEERIKEMYFLSINDRIKINSSYYKSSVDFEKLTKEFFEEISRIAIRFKTNQLINSSELNNQPINRQFDENKKLENLYKIAA